MSQEHCWVFEISLGYPVSSRPAWVRTWRRVTSANIRKHLQFCMAHGLLCEIFPGSSITLLLILLLTTIQFFFRSQKSSSHLLFVHIAVGPQVCGGTLFKTTQLPNDCAETQLQTLSFEGHRLQKWYRRKTYNVKRPSDSFPEKL